MTPEARRAAIVAMHTELLRLQKADPTVCGATVVLPSGEIIELRAEPPASRH